ncbi:hypothetical protein F5J12DRAFT_817833 [Pisolithus orientalis]|uniref:uncharacterized protein n=1 Tax=Pisolithus orientalis TaxID=936130 RepID=UPI0022253F7F|nr:uncharacterized protein F5J12DRAFT_817833 [Pisolithus orientalis]KAI6012400.1 hypothetical protein F5J12DRAFT_817833 [Pisolithus orientalis]
MQWPCRTLAVLVAAIVVLLSVRFAIFLSCEELAAAELPLQGTFHPGFFLPSFVDGIDVNISRARSQNTVTPRQRPDVTAIVLNWSRLDNVVRIVSLLCEESLLDTVAEAFIWNNSPKELTYETFASSGCPKAKLRLYNSERNLYFHARFLACVQAKTQFCFFQDDDYLVLPQIIQTLRYRIAESPQTAIHLLPAHEHLSSRLRTILTPSGVHSGFAWLGHGAIMSRKQAVDFVSLLRHLNMPPEEVRLADNYFTILSNQIPEIWFDHGVELGGGEPFTIGQEGHERNLRHIMNACAYLDQLVSGIHDISHQETALEAFPFVKAAADIGQWFISRSPCLGSSCLLETNIRLLGDDVPSGHAATDLIAREGQYASAMDKKAVLNYTRHSLSKAVDGMPATAFRSTSLARRGEYVMLDSLYPVGSLDVKLEVVFLVPPSSEEILRKSVFQSSVDGGDWFSSPHPLMCRNTSMTTTLLYNRFSEDFALVECSVRVVDGNVRYFKALLKSDASVAWTISEIWLRELS